ncbi:hypothetical protein IJG78_02770 [Candidatus Saccharibacteria bacterium]|nr:hypothetical protein [Candidatus Saccharibacteria bacterium]MBQ3436782.1 hypothetical protein [Candidatus Saccharibacteria bacterium]MBQ6394568.1 hypothetical protein [Candidatus Saccharibacteria bacterium]MBR0415715.1 hypothetical protein [Candidatus Saccharibacteria bacterium]
MSTTKSKSANQNSALLEKRKASTIKKLNYENAKQKVLYLEENNYGYVFILKTNDDWYKIMSHSALMYIHYVWPIARDKLNLTTKAPNLIADSDFRYKAPIGIITRNAIEEFSKILETAGAKKVKVEGTNNDLISAYKLAREMSEDEFWRIKKYEDDLWSKANTIIVPKAVYPNLSIDVQEAAMQIYFVARKLKQTDREFFGEDMLFLTKQMAKNVILAEREHIEWPELFEYLPVVVAELSANISMLATFRLVDNKVLIRLNDALLKIEKDLKVAKKDYAKRRSNKVAGKSQAE